MAGPVEYGGPGGTKIRDGSRPIKTFQNIKYIGHQDIRTSRQHVGSNRRTRYSGYRA
jgi:hypothetical protein